MATKHAVANHFKQILSWEKIKICQEQAYLFNGCFSKVFYKTNTCPRRSVKQPTFFVYMYIQNEKQLKTFLIFKNGNKTCYCKSLFKQMLLLEKTKILQRTTTFA